MQTLKFRKNSDNSIVEFLQFNYDGIGSAIVLTNKEVFSFTLVEVNDIIKSANLADCKYSLIE